MRTPLFARAVFCVLLWVDHEAEAITTATNVDISEPTVIRSPAIADDPEDGFGWAAIFHQIEPVLRSDSMDEAIRKTRFAAVCICAQSMALQGSF